MPKLVILNRLTEDRLAVLQRHSPHAVVESYPNMESALPHVQDADAIAMWGFTDPTPLFSAAPKLRWIHSLSAGIESLLPPEMITNDIILTHTAGIHDRPVAERAMAMILSLAHQLPAAITAQHNGEWKRFSFRPLYEQTILIVGYGGIGQEIARLAKTFGMHVIACKRQATRATNADETITQADLPAYLPHADIIVAALPGTPETENLFDAAHFAAMKPSAFFVNIARGSLVDQDALTHALQTGAIAGAGLDVFETEPLPADHPLRHLDRVIVTAHSAAMVDGYFDRVLGVLAENWQRYLTHQPLLHVVDKEKRY